MRYATGFLIFLSLFSSLSGEEKSFFNLTLDTLPSGMMSDPPKKKLKKKEETDETPVPAGPVLTGPLLTPTANTIPPGHFNTEPYIFVATTTGNYNNNWRVEKECPHPQTITLLDITDIGLNSFMDMQIAVQFLLNSLEDIDIWRFGDFQIGLDFLLLREDEARGIPGIKLSVDEFFPTGAYQHLRPENHGADIGGRGAFSTTFGLVFSYLWRFKNPHFLAARLLIAYDVATNVSVHGVNTYGGDPTTVGRVYPGDIFQIIGGFEYTLTKCWALALDIEAIFADRNKFRGCTIDPVGEKSAIQFSMAPAIEFNHSVNLGMIGGVWFTFAGKNSPVFWSGVLAINFYI